MTVKKGDMVKVHYTGTLDNGEVFDTSEGRDPLQFQVGAMQVIKGFDDAVTGMKEGEEKTVTLKPEEAYGQVNPQLVQEVPREQLPKDKEPEAGMMLMIALPNGQQMPAKIAAIEGDKVKLDLNHPLAGKTLTFKVKVESIEEGKAPTDDDSLEGAVGGPDKKEEKK